jgi:hypothetical protein
MKQFLVLLFLLLIPVTVQGQSITTTVCPGAGCQDINVGGRGSIGIQVTGTWTGTITFRASIDNATFTDLEVLPSNSGTAVTTTTANGVWSAPVAGYNTIRIVFTAHSSGTANLFFRTTNEARKGGGGGGAPLDATYITQTADATLTNEQALASLSTGVLTVTTGTGVVDSITDNVSGTGVDNQVAVFNAANVVEGDANLTWDGSTLDVTGTYSVDGTAVLSGSLLAGR